MSDQHHVQIGPARFTVHSQSGQQPLACLLRATHLYMQPAGTKPCLRRCQVQAGEPCRSVLMHAARSGAQAVCLILLHAAGTQQRLEFACGVFMCSLNWRPPMPAILCVHSTRCPLQLDSTHRTCIRQQGWSTWLLAVSRALLHCWPAAALALCASSEWQPWLYPPRGMQLLRRPALLMLLVFLPCARQAVGVRVAAPGSLDHITPCCSEACVPGQSCTVILTLF